MAALRVPVVPDRAERAEVLEPPEALAVAEPAEVVAAAQAGVVLEVLPAENSAMTNGRTCFDREQ